MSKFDCLVCRAPLPEDYDPQYCCAGQSNECGCMGQPTNPPICSDECWNKLMSRGQSSSSGTAPTVTDGGPAEAGHLTEQRSTESPK